MAFAPKPGCPMCSIVSAGYSSAPGTPNSPSVASKQHEILWRDDNFTVYRETAYPVSSKGHIIVVFKYVLHPTVLTPAHAQPYRISSLHVPSIYTLVRSPTAAQLYYSAALTRPAAVSCSPQATCPSLSPSATSPAVSSPPSKPHHHPTPLLSPRPNSNRTTPPV